MSANAGSQIVGQVQFMGMLSELDVKWPESLDDIFRVLSFANLDFRKVIPTKDFPVVDFRLMFMLFAIVLPILICLATLLLFASPVLVLIFFCVATGSMLLIAYLFSKIFSDTIDDFNSQQMLFVGIVLIAVPVFMMIAAWIFRKIRAFLDARAGKKRKRDEFGDHMRKIRIQERKFHRWMVFKFTIYGFACLFICAFLMGGFDVPLSVGNAGFYAGIGFAGAALVSFVMIGILSFDRTRRALQTASDTVQRYGLMLIIAAITASFVPAVSYSSTTFLCTTYECPAFTKFNPMAYRKTGDYSVTTDLFCDECNFYPTDKCTPLNASALCKASSDYRNWREPETPCDDAAQVLYYASAVIVIVVYLISIPTLFFIIIRELTTSIAERVQLAEPQETDDPAADDRENWRRKLILVQPTAASLYEAYSFGHRYFSLWTLLHRLLITVSLVIVGPLMTDLSIPLILLLHTLMLLMVVCYRPYLRPLEHWLGVILAFCNVFNSLYSLGYRHDVLPEGIGMTVVFILLNMVIPPVAVGIMFIVAARRATNQDQNIRRLNSMRRDPFADEDMDDEMREMQKRYEDDQDADKNKMEQMALDKATQGRILTRCFLFIGIFFFTALTAALIGYFQQEEPKFRIVTSPMRQSIDFTMYPYKSWEEMTNNCCCMETKHPAYDYDRMERWVCNSGYTFSRGRISRDKKHNGTLVRDICAPNPRLRQCSIGNVGGEVHLICPPAIRDQLMAEGVSQYAYDYYF